VSVNIGERAPDFTLPDTLGHGWPLIGDGEAPTVIVFTCNHCPYALAWQDRIADAARDYADEDVRFLAVNASDAERYPDDSYEAMQSRVVREDWPMPYLHDPTQQVARAYGAKTTPHVFVLDAEGTLRYRGAPDSDCDDPAQRAGWLREALDAVLAGRDPERPETEPAGGLIEFKS
jgi:peroxiredoxin